MCVRVRREKPSDLLLVVWTEQEALALASETTGTMAKAAAEVGATRYLANATIYLDMFGHVVVAWLWLKQAIVAEAALGEATGDEADFLRGKVTAAKYFYRYELPAIRQQCALLASMDDTCVVADASGF